jgi:hypothetical protein
LDPSSGVNPHLLQARGFLVPLAECSRLGCGAPAAPATSVSARAHPFRRAAASLWRFGPGPRGRMVVLRNWPKATILRCRRDISTRYCGSRRCAGRLVRGATFTAPPYAPRKGSSVEKVGNRNIEQTSRRVASVAGKTLANPHASKRDKTLAASALSQARPHQKPRGK